MLLALFAALNGSLSEVGSNRKKGIVLVEINFALCMHGVDFMSSTGAKIGIHLIRYHLVKISIYLRQLLSEKVKIISMIITRCRYV